MKRYLLVTKEEFAWLYDINVEAELNAITSPTRYSELKKRVADRFGVSPDDFSRSNPVHVQVVDEPPEVRIVEE